ncbi:MAG: DUF4270 family protein [Bacteroidetes bacterium]|nr:DUF4270 family protein [Bacteroidota bacterium]
MNSKRRFLLSSLVISLLTILVLFSCKKDPYEVGLDLLPPSDTLKIKTTDTCTVIAYTVRVDSITTSNCPDLSLGSIADPVFGNSTIGLYTQLQPSSASVDFGIAPAVDSLILMLYYSGYYGDTTTQQRIRVYEVAEDLHIDSGYYSNRKMQVYPNLLSELTFKPSPKDSVKVGGTMYSAHIRINLSKYTNYFANKLLYGPPSVYTTNAMFNMFMKGLYIETQPVNYGGALLNFNISESLSKMILFFHNQTTDSLTYAFLMNTSCARFLHIDHNNYIDAEQDLKQQMVNRDTLLGRNMLYLQGLGGTRIKFRMPYMMNFGKNRKIAINDALLLFENPSTDTTLKPPSNIILIRDSAGYVGSVIDELEGSSYFGGMYNKTNRTYYFRLTRHIQKLIDGYYYKNRELYIQVNDPLRSTIYPNRVMINGYNPAIPGAYLSRFRLQITYTLLN